jgi:hypothetical protein
MTVVVNEMDVEVQPTEREARGERAPAAKPPDENKLLELFAYEQWRQARLQAD